MQRTEGDPFASMVRTGLLPRLVIAGFATGLTVIKSVGTKANVDLRLAEAAVLLTVALRLRLVALCAMSLGLGGHD